jgi:uncharacterized protein with PIN domain
MAEASAPRFVADDMVARLGRWLRVIGCDTVIWRGACDSDLLALASREERAIVTRDTHLEEGAPRDVDIAVLHEDNPLLQFAEVVQRFHLDLHAARYTRCQRCNGLLERADKERHREEIPPRSFEAFEEFWRCTGCGQLYWHGDHHASMERTLAWVESQIAQ